MRIAFVVSTFPSISEKFILDQMIGLINRGHEVDIYASAAGQEGLVHDGVARYQLDRRVKYLPDRRGGLTRRLVGAVTELVEVAASDLGQAVNAVNVFRDGWERLPSRVCWSHWFGPKHEYDVVHCHFAPNGVLAVWWRKLGLVSGKIVTTFHGIDVNCRRECYRLRDYDLLFREGDAFTANSEFTRRNAEALGCPVQKIVRLPVGLDVRRIEWRERGRRDVDELKLLTVARLVECKGVEYAIRAIANLKKAACPVRYDIVGDGVLRPALEQLAEGLGLVGVVQFHGWKTGEELERLYDVADVFVLPSVTASSGQEEAQGLVLQEAQAYGLPVVTTDVGGVAEGVAPGESAFLVAERDSEALAERIAYLSVHPEIWSAMGRAGRAHVEAGYDLNRLNDALEDLYKGLVK